MRSRVVMPPGGGRQGPAGLGDGQGRQAGRHATVHARAHGPSHQCAASAPLDTASQAPSPGSTTARVLLPLPSGWRGWSSPLPPPPPPPPLLPPPAASRSVRVSRREGLPASPPPLSRGDMPPPPPAAAAAVISSASAPWLLLLSKPRARGAVSSALPSRCTLARAKGLLATAEGLPDGWSKGLLAAAANAETSVGEARALAPLTGAPASSDRTAASSSSGASTADPVGVVHVESGNPHACRLSRGVQEASEATSLPSPIDSGALPTFSMVTAAAIPPSCCCSCTPRWAYRPRGRHRSPVAAVLTACWWPCSAAPLLQRVSGVATRLQSVPGGGGAPVLQTTPPMRQRVPTARPAHAPPHAATTAFVPHKHARGG